MARMFTIDGKRMRTWNPISGCLHSCTYCWARKLAETRLKGSPRYKDGFQPTFHAEDLKKKFKPGEFVFVTDMGDAWGWWTPRDQLEQVIEVERKFPETRFLNQTKSPMSFHRFQFPGNTVLGTTIETNRYFPQFYVGQGVGAPSDRMGWMASLAHPHKFVSIEPIMDFDLEEFVRWIGHIRPEIVEVGADNYGHHLPEPDGMKVVSLLNALREFVPQVIMKDGLERLTT